MSEVLSRYKAEDLVHEEALEKDRLSHLLAKSSVSTIGYVEESE